jgi:DNA-binding NarL/FixJ family response regulator
MAGRMMQKMVKGAKDQAASPLEVLADRELEVFQMVGRGMGTRQIAEELHVGIKTVESYKARIKEKLRLADGNELLQHAIHWVQGRAGG